MRRADPRAAGFTLFEVMAAVLVLGMLYAVLANAAMQGLHSEGETRRRFQASLLADQALAALETQLTLGVIPDSGTQEEAEDPYLVSVTVQPFDPSVLIPPDSLEGEARASHETPAETLLVEPSSGNEGRLRRIDVRVTWEESGNERSVTRTTFAFDTSGLEELFPQEEAEGQQPAEDEQGEEDQDQQPKNNGADNGGRGPKRNPLDQPPPEDE